MIYDVRVRLGNAGVYDGVCLLDAAGFVTSDEWGLSPLDRTRDPFKTFAEGTIRYLRSQVRDMMFHIVSLWNRSTWGGLNKKQQNALNIRSSCWCRMCRTQLVSGCSSRRSMRR